tara:strand:+ start:252 stop:425 length:174 start_codon:yes stop_codon:yes gene_type:complete
MKKTYDVGVEVKKYYTVTVEANSKEEAFNIAEYAERPEFCDDIQVYAYTASEVEVAE